MVQPQDSVIMYETIDQMMYAFQEQMSKIESAMEISREMVRTNLRTPENPYGLIEGNSEEYMECLNAECKLTRLRALLKTNLVSWIKK